VSGPALLACLIALAPAPDPAATRAALERAIQLANEDPAAGVAALREAIAELQADAIALADDPAARAERDRASSLLARALLASGDVDGAKEAIDAAIRSAGPEPLPVGELGPGIAALHAERVEALARGPRASLAVECGTPCRILVDERPVTSPLPDVPAGPYRIFVGPKEIGGPEPLRVTVQLEGPHTIHWPPPREPEPTTAAPPSADRRRRALPRWLEIGALVAGAAGVGVGAALLAIDGRCPGGGDVEDPDACPDLYDTKTGGIVAISVGGAVMSAGGVMLVVDEVRVGRGGARSAVVGLRGRF
jgi:hypothetical protein